MRIIGNMINLNPYSRTTVPDLARNQSKSVTNNNSYQKIQSAATNNQPKKVYFKTDGMLFSGGNGIGLSFYIKYAENSNIETPIMIAKGVDENGNEFEQTININDINPHNATIVEMRALEAYLNVDKGGGLSSFPPSGSLGLNDTGNFIAMFRKNINDMNLLREQQLAQFYSNNMHTYLDFINSKNR